MEKLFESRKALAANAAIPNTVDAEIIFTRAPFVQYEQILLDKKFRQHLETIIVSKTILRMGAQKTPIQKTYEIQKGSHSLNAEFLDANRQFDWIEISIVPEKSDKHATIYELPDEEKYFSLKSDKKVSLDLRATSGYVKEAEKLERNNSKINLQITLKDSADFNLRVRIWAYSLSEYLYVLSKSRLTLKHRTYTINQSDKDFLE